ncbi:MAG: hypothetical protein FWG20_06035 [Candidatus Cloacimonetes bacterium]|nr:hypothetical protein [Candidatus Cloacimonadota bacterium]
MSVLFGKLFWGCLLVLWGFVLILEKIIGKNIPFGRFFLAFLLIYLGLYLIFKVNKPNKVKIRTHINTERSATAKDPTGEYSVVFGKNVIDLANIDSTTKQFEVNTVFATTDLYLSENKTYVLKLTTFFGEVTVPKLGAVRYNNNEMTIGDEGAEEKQLLELNTVFGKTNIMVK